jgi:hypothetical protein
MGTGRQIRPTDVPLEPSPLQFERRARGEAGLIAEAAPHHPSIEHCADRVLSLQAP